jgi:hypothetical protein
MLNNGILARVPDSRSLTVTADIESWFNRAVSHES